jgi:hypothetical protein
MKGYPAPLTWDRLLELAAQGHDHYDAALTSTRARQLVASVREHCKDLEERNEAGWAIAKARLASFRAATATLERVRAEVDKWSGSGCEDGDTPAFCAMVGIAAALARPGFEAPKVCTECEAPIGPDRHFCQPEDFHQTVGDALARALAAANATLERVRDLADSTSSDGNTWVYLRDLRAAIDGQPEAPRAKCAYCSAPPNAPDSYLDRCERCISQPEATKGQEAGRWMVGEDGLARKQSFPITESLTRRTYDLERDLAAANARIAELETQHDADIDAIARAVRHEDAANARADAAERKYEFCSKDRAAYRAAETVAVTERDQLAVRVKQWESAGRDVGIDCPGAMQQAKGLAVAACEALGLKYEETAPADFRAIQGGVCLREVVGCDSLHHALENGLQCTPGERAVLKGAGVIAQWVLEDWASFAHAAMVFARAELANRAAKALKPPAEPSELASAKARIAELESYSQGLAQTVDAMRAEAEQEKALQDFDRRHPGEEA